MRIHRLIWIAALALMLVCMGAFAITAHAADTQPLAISAWMSGDKLLIEVHHGRDTVEAVYINNIRVGYLINGRLELPAVNYAGTEQYFTIYAADFAGNQSNIVLIQNPYYAPPEIPACTATPAPTPIPSPSPIPATPTPEPSTMPAPPTIDEPNKPNPFTPDGEG